MVFDPACLRRHREQTRFHLIRFSDGWEFPCSQILRTELQKFRENEQQLD
jgi:hypothetical protein